MFYDWLQNTGHRGGSSLGCRGGPGHPQTADRGIIRCVPAEWANRHPWWWRDVFLHGIVLYVSPDHDLFCHIQVQSAGTVLIPAELISSAPVTVDRH